MKEYFSRSKKSTAAQIDETLTKARGILKEGYISPERKQQIIDELQSL